MPGLAPQLGRSKRCSDLLSASIRDCLRGVEREREVLGAPLLIGTTEKERPAALRDSEILLQDLDRDLLERLKPTLVKEFPQGQTAGFHALLFARDLFASRRASAALICGVDSYISAVALDWLQRTSRLKTPANSDGVIPGEAAACILVTKAAPIDRALVRVSGLGFAHESASVLDEAPLTGTGLVSAARAALVDAGMRLEQVSFRLSDVTGESYGFKEQSLMISRMLRSRRESFPLWHCADSIGDVGAAAGVCHLVVAHRAFLKKYAPGTSSICCTSSVFGDRAVAVVQHEERV